MVIIFLLSNEVSGTSSGRSDAIVNALTYSLHINLPQELLTFLTRKAAHIIAYFFLGMLTLNVLRSYDTSIRRMIFLSIVIVSTYAISDEIHQLFVPGRSGEARDVFIDAIAGTTGIFAYHSMYRIRKNSFNSKKDV